MGMVGGGPGSFIGPLHRLGAQLSERVELVAGVFSRTPERSRAAAAAFGVNPDRCYPTFDAMFAAERSAANGIDLVAIAAPNHLHLPIALEALACGIHVISDKPATANLAEALALREALGKTALIYAVTFSYTGYPMIREARARVLNGEIGRVRKVNVTYSQGWLSSALERSGNERAAWRTNPVLSGIGGCISDLGVHAFNLAEYVTADTVKEILPDLNNVVPGRELDDDCNVLLHFSGGAVGVLSASQVAFGERNALSIQVYGDAGAIHWSFDQADALRLVRTNGAAQTLNPSSLDLLVREPVIPGLGNGLTVPFMIQYRDFARAIDGTAGIIDGTLPGIDAAVRSMCFVERAARSRGQRSDWISLDLSDQRTHA
jgi:predicted dehydrogenase